LNSRAITTACIGRTSRRLFRTYFTTIVITTELCVLRKALKFLRHHSAERAGRANIANEIEASRLGVCSATPSIWTQISTAAIDFIWRCIGHVVARHTAAPAASDIRASIVASPAVVDGADFGNRSTVIFTRRASTQHTSDCWEACERLTVGSVAEGTVGWRISCRAVCTRRHSCTRHTICEFNKRTQQYK